MADQIEEQIEETQEEETVSSPKNKKSIIKEISKLAPLFLVSFAAHMVILLIISLIPTETPQEEKTITIITEYDEPEEEEEEIEEMEEVEIVKENVEVDAEITPEDPVQELEEIVEEVSEESEEEMDIALEFETLNPTEMNMNLAVLGISGVSGGASHASGIMSGRFSTMGKRKASGAKNYNVVNEALKWLAKQQTEQGTWPFSGHPNAINGACALAFLGNGNSTRSGRYKDVVKKFVDFYVKRQPNDGGHGNHGHATPFVIMAMCDAYAMNHSDRELKAYCEKAIEYVSKTQLDNGGWSGGSATVEKPTPEVDVAQSAWYVMALVSARFAGIDFDPQVLIRARELFTKLASGKFEGQVKVTSHGGQDDFFDRPHSVASYAATNLVFMGIKPSDTLIKRQATNIFDTMPSKGKRNYWLLYNQGLGLFQMGGSSKYWRTFKDNIITDIRNEAKKTKEGLFWDNSHLYTGKSKKSDTSAKTGYWGDCGATAMAILNLQVFYRYGDIQSAYAEL